MNVNEYGVTLQFGVSFNMFGNTSLTLNFTKPSGATLSVAATLGTVQVTTTLGIFAANTYATYRFVEGDVDESGEWTVRLVYLDSSPAKLISTRGYFVVGT